MRLKRATFGDMRPGRLPRSTSFLSPKSLRLDGGELVRRFAPAEIKSESEIPSSSITFAANPRRRAPRRVVGQRLHSATQL